MPSFDGGHYFLTVVAPVRPGSTVEPFLGRALSHQHQLAEKLALLPTGRQTVKSVASEGVAGRSPFARNSINHLARFVIIDNPAFNGRSSQDTIVSTLKKINPLEPQPTDGLSTPFLLSAMGRAGPRAHVVGEVAAWGVLVVPALFGVLALCLYGPYRWVMRRGAGLFPRAPDSDLPTVLKSLFIQQNFTRFAIETQGLGDAELHDRFGAFFDAVQPNSPTPTQGAGEVQAPRMEWVR